MLSTTTFLPFFIFPALITAQTTTIPTVNPPTTAISPCIMQCLNQAGIAAGCLPGDKICPCTNHTFQEAVRTCMEVKCSPVDQETVVVLQNQHCNASPPMRTIAPSTSIPATATAHIAATHHSNAGSQIEMWGGGALIGIAIGLGLLVVVL